eukprot:TRINITY_DN10318_c0_g1_i1.p1 TRINITY_DN10318_c0_g1~~TRINITY_DN10318_c0_g1_i1.p1  ORF type:complete len:989 (-),score=261.99 TRINITY_DN10318_c0_g1_i1:1624-4158(-)
MAAIQETKNLTLSFGWGATDAFRQHDVQELLRKLFEALEICFKHGNLQDTSLTPLNQLYEGLLKDYIQCKQNPSHERVRYDMFMDLMLSIRNVDSLEGALDSYVAEETLDGDNRWFCDECQARVDAGKGLRLKSTPLFLTLQLKRFDYDYQTWQRIKLNNRVTFPLEFDVKPWLSQDSDANSTKYQLFSVLIHQGGAQGGHYYAIISDVHSKKWYKFNDSSVTEIEAKDIELMYGEQPKDETGPKKIVQGKLYSSNAYLLFYRREGDPIPPERSIPEYIKKYIEEENEKFTKAKEEFIQRRDNLPLDLHYRENIIKLHIDKNKTLKDATVQAFSLAGLTGSQYTLECVRLRKFNPETGTLGRVWKADEETKSLESLSLIKTSVLKLEIREPSESFLEDSGEYKLQVIRAANGKFEEAVTVNIPNRETTLLQFTQILETQFGWESSKIRVVKVSPDASTQILTRSEWDNKELQKDVGLVDGNSLHVEQVESHDDPSTIVQLFEEATNLIQVYVNKLDEKEYSVEIPISKKKSLSDLRQVLSKMLEVSPNEFQICRSVLGNQYKDESKTLEELGIYDAQPLFLKKGEPLKPNQVKISFSIYNREHDSFTPLEVQYDLSRDSTIKEVRTLASSVIPPSYTLVGPSHLRLRAQHGKKAGPILYDSGDLQGSIANLSDHQVIAVQILDREEFVKPNEVLIQLQRWYPSKQELQEKGEDIVLPRGSNILTLKKHLAIHQQEIPEQQIAIAKPFSYQLKNKNTLSSLLNWDLDQETLINDGDMVLYKDSRDPEVEIEGYKTPREGGLKMEVSRPKEVGITIHTVFDETGREKFQKLFSTLPEQREPEKEQN